MTGLARSTVSPSSSIMMRSTPWVDGCCGPMLMIIVSSTSGHGPPVSTSSCVARLAGERTQLLRALVGLRLEPPIVLVALGGRRRRSSTASLARSSWARVALERDRHARRRVVLAQRVADPVVGHEDAGEVGVAGERRCRRGRRPRARRSSTPG